MLIGDRRFTSNTTENVKIGSMELWKFRSCELAIYRTTPAPGSEAVRFGICRSQPLCTARTRFRSIVNFWRAQNWGSRLPPGPGITRNYYGKTHQVSQREKERERARKVTISQLTCFEHMMKMIRNFVAWTSLRLFITKENSYVVSWSAGDAWDPLWKRALAGQWSTSK